MTPFRVTEKTTSKIYKKLKHFSYIMELNTPAHTVGELKNLGKDKKIFQCPF